MRIAGFAPLMLLALLGCAGMADPGAGTEAQEIAGLRRTAPEVGRLVRVAMACDMALSVTARDRAERIELAALELLRREGGQAASEEYLRSLQPPGFDPRRRGRDRATWCAAEQANVQRAEAMLMGSEGAALVERAEAVRAAATR